MLLHQKNIIRTEGFLPDPSVKGMKFAGSSWRLVFLRTSGDIRFGLMKKGNKMMARIST